MKSVDRIITAKDYGGAKNYILKTQRDMYKRGVAVAVLGLDSEPVGTPVKARIWQGQWIADCECKGASFVDPDEPVFFCFSCGNRAHGSMVRPVEFPPKDEREEIEKLLLERPVNDMAGLTDLERAGMAVPILKVFNRPLSRSWRPGESVQTLYDQQDEIIQLWKEGKLGDENVIR